MSHLGFTIDTSNPRVGWECPKCHACLSPDVSMCERCAPPYNAQPYVPSYPYPYPTVLYPTTPWWGIHPPYQYDYGSGWEIISTDAAEIG